ncbi:hypothetical protein FRB98_008469 [Tulasnella sp. 332]|nr:hypothetical protein FRB98_008469 [Tulasnella sp. 332]
MSLPHVPQVPHMPRMPHIPLGRHPPKPKPKPIAPYVIGGAKIALDTVSKVASTSSIPGVKAVADVALQIIATVGSVKANRSDTKNLIDRIVELVAVVSSTCAGEGDEELSSKLQDSVEKLVSDLTQITDEVEEMRRSTNPRHLKTLINGCLLHYENGQKIKEFSSRLGWAMNVFQVRPTISALATQSLDTQRRQVERQLKDAICLLQVADRAEEIHSCVQSVHDVVRTMAMLGAVPSASSLTLAALPPPKPAVFCGRDDIVKEISSRLVGTAVPRLALLGAGGIGKTAVALNVLGSDDVVRHYGEARYFVRCEEATGSVLLVELLATSLGIKKSSNDRLQDVMALLTASHHPILVLFDSFETPWDASEERSHVEEILCTVASLPHVAILITMRSDVPPSIHVKWSEPPLDALPALKLEASLELYVRIHPAASSDPALEQLLADLSYMPLAITLMASLGRHGNETPTNLLKNWKDERVGITLLNGGTSKSNSVNRSIELSIESNLMKLAPEALTLLSIVAMLPAGASPWLLENDIPNIRSPLLAKARLLEATLAYNISNTNALQLHSPIRLYVSRYHPPSKEVRDAIYIAFADFVSRHNSRLGDPSFPRDVETLSREETNLEVILPAAITDGEHWAMDAAASFCWYQYWTRPRLGIITCLVEVSKRMRRGHFLAHSLVCLGNIQYRLNVYDKAKAAYTKASRVYSELKNKQGVASCLEGIGDVHRARGEYEEARSAYSDASRHYQALGDEMGTASCKQGLGHVLQMQGRYDDARIAYEDALKGYQKLGYGLGLASCQQGLGHVFRRQNHHEEATKAFEAASQRYRELGNPLGLGDCLQGLGDILRMQGHHHDARLAFQESCQGYRNLGDRLGTSNGLRGMGDAYRMEGRYDDAKVVYEEALRVYREINDRTGTANTMGGLGDVYRMQGRHKDALLAYKEALGEYRKLKDGPRIADCLGRIGYVLQTQREYDGAVSAFEEALGRFRQASERTGMMKCQRSLSDIYLMRGRYDEARAAYEEALQISQESNHLDPAGSAYCLKRLGDVHRHQNRPEWARNAYTDASKRYAELGDELGAADCQRKMAEVSIAEGRYLEARGALEEALRSYRRLDSRVGTANCLKDLGQVHCIQGQENEAIRAISEARDLFTTLDGLRDAVAECTAILDGLV